MDKPTEIESLTKARAKAQSIVDMYTPTNAGRTAAVTALGAMFIEFEAAVREDERSKVEAGAKANAEALYAGRESGRFPPKQDTPKALDPAAAPAPPPMLKDPNDTGLPTIPGLDTLENAGSVTEHNPLNGPVGASSLPREIGDAPPVPTGEGFKEPPGIAPNAKKGSETKRK